MTDLSKIDFTQLTLPDWSGDRVVCKWSRTAGSLLVKRDSFDFASLSPGRPWVYDRGPWSLLEVAKTYTDRVDEFIAEESARLATEDEEVNFVPVPWQDVEWLDNSGATVEFYDVLFGCFRERDLAKYGQGDPLYRYRADRRTFPAGYDQEKPRWVEVDWRDVTRLEGSCATIAYILKNGTHLPREFVETVGVKPRDGQRYAVDVHTLPPDVPLHVEPPKSEPRPCTREFALRRPDESEWRVQQRDGHRLSWSTWQPMSRVPLFQESVDGYEFRTTARETQTVAQLSVSMYIRPYADASDLLRKLGSLPCGCYKITATRIA